MGTNAWRVSEIRLKELIRGLKQDGYSQADVLDIIEGLYPPVGWKSDEIRQAIWDVWSRRGP